MITKNLKNRMTKAGLVLSAVFGLLLLTGVTANAQYRDDGYGRNRGYGNGGYGNGGYGNRGYGNGNYEAARRFGFEDGQYTGSEDARRNQSYNPERAGNYRKGTNGYNGRGSKDAYKQAYRQAFIDGYNSTYNRGGRGRYGNRGYYGNSTGSRVLRDIFGGY